MDLNSETNEYNVNTIAMGEQEKFQIAKWVLFGVATIFILSGIAYLTNDKTGKDIFDTSKTLLPSIVTLVLGYYFSEKSKA